MNYKKVQKSLETQRKEENEKHGFDTGGCLLFCRGCPHGDHSHPTDNGKCYADEATRLNECPCAKNYEIVGER
jgi:hypothetical protein